LEGPYDDPEPPPKSYFEGALVCMPSKWNAYYLQFNSWFDWQL